MSEKVTDLDPRGLIHEAYVMKGLYAPDCRSIYLDWALGLPAGTDAIAATASMLAAFSPLHPDHPMTAVLREGVEGQTRPRSARGRRAGPQA